MKARVNRENMQGLAQKLVNSAGQVLSSFYEPPEKPFRLSVLIRFGEDEQVLALLQHPQPPAGDPADEEARHAAAAGKAWR